MNEISRYGNLESIQKELEYITRTMNGKKIPDSLAIRKEINEVNESLSLLLHELEGIYESHI